MLKLVTPVGKIDFNALDQARGFKGSDENKAYNIELIFDKTTGTKIVEELTVLHDKLLAAEIEKLKAKGKPARLGAAGVAFREIEGGIKLNFKRKETDGKAIIIDLDGKQVQGGVRRGGAASVAYEVRPYVMGTAFGITLKLLGVKLETADERQDVEDLFGVKVDTKPTEEVKKTIDKVTDLF